MKRSRCILRAFINELTQIMRAKFSLALSRHLSRYSRGPEMRREGRCDVTLMYRCAAPLMAYIWRVPPTRATLGYYESLINYANDLRTTTVYPSSSPFYPPTRQDAQSRCYASLCPSPALSCAEYRSSRRRFLLSLPLSHYFSLILQQRRPSWHGGLLKLPN